MGWCSEGEDPSFPPPPPPLASIELVEQPIQYGVTRTARKHMPHTPLKTSKSQNALDTINNYIKYEVRPSDLSYTLPLLIPQSNSKRSQYARPSTALSSYDLNYHPLGSQVDLRFASHSKLPINNLEFQAHRLQSLSASQPSLHTWRDEASSPDDQDTNFIDASTYRNTLWNAGNYAVPSSRTTATTVRSLLDHHQRNGFLKGQAQSDYSLHGWSANHVSHCGPPPKSVSLVQIRRPDVSDCRTSNQDVTRRQAVYRSQPSMRGCRDIDPLSPDANHLIYPAQGYDETKARMREGSNAIDALKYRSSSVSNLSTARMTDPYENERQLRHEQNGKLSAEQDPYCHLGNTLAANKKTEVYNRSAPSIQGLTTCNQGYMTDPYGNERQQRHEQNSKLSAEQDPYCHLGNTLVAHKKTEVYNRSAPSIQVLTPCNQGYFHHHHGYAPYTPPGSDTNISTGAASYHSAPESAPYTPLGSTIYTPPGSSIYTPPGSTTYTPPGSAPYTPPASAPHTPLPPPSVASDGPRKGSNRRRRINSKYKYRRASCPLAFERGGSVASFWNRCGGGMDDGGSSVSSASCGSCGSAGNEEVMLRILVPELSVERCLTFHSQDLVWTVKQAALTSLPKELRESFNYGLFCPPQNGRAGKFLDEERPLADYPLSSSPMGYLELKYKRRVYKMLKLEEKTLRALHTRANLRRFLEWVKEGNVEKVAKLCSKGLDPNFHCQETGDTPLTIAARGNLKGRKGCAALLVALVNGGALLDYRTKDGLTAMHRAVQADNLQAVRTLLDLGASPNYRDHRGLTPLYYCVTYAKDPLVCEALLHDYSIIGVADHQGWQETHQACRNKLVQHLEHLLFYGAELNGQNASGNTPLHVCAVNNLEDCARVLLFRGCDKNALNFANQNPYQVAIISGNLELAEIINKHNADDVVPFKSPPRYNPRRRVSGAPLLRATSDPRLETPCVHKPPSPAPSSRSIPPFSSASSLSETSTGSGSTASSSHISDAGDEGNGSYEGRTHSCSTALEALSDSSSGICSSYQSSGDVSHPHATLTRSAPHALLCHTKVQENVEEEDEGEEEEEEESGSDSSSNGVGGGADGATGGGGGGGGITYDVGALVVCVAKQTVKEEGQLALNQGDIVQVTGSTDDGLLEGMVRGVTGTFPPSCVQPVRLRNPQAVRDSLLAPQVNRSYSRSHSVEGSNSPPSVTHYGTAPRVRKPQPPTPRCVVLHRGRKGFGFVLRGAKATSPLMDRGATPRGGIALQYLDDVDPGGVADLAGLKPGDYLLKINGEDVSQASHEHVVTLIRKSADLVDMTVVTPEGEEPSGGSPHKPPYGATPYTTSSLKRGCQTLPRKHNFSRSISQSGPPSPRPQYQPQCGACPGP